jgi:enoyl-CoA hydratase
VLSAEFFHLEQHDGVCVLRLQSDDGTNRLTQACVLALAKGLRDLTCEPKPLIITGNRRFFSAGADLREIAALTGPGAYQFSRMGQTLMNTVEHFPAPVYAAIYGYCMGGGLDLVLACHGRIASPGAILGHRGAALGMITGWGGTQRLPRLVGNRDALAFGLVDAVADDPVAEAARQIHAQNAPRRNWPEFARCGSAVIP